MNVSCPTCNKTLAWSTDNLFRPFCSERCKLIDLGAWAASEHTIAGEPEDESGTPFELTASEDSYD